MLNINLYVTLVRIDKKEVKVKKKAILYVISYQSHVMHRIVERHLYKSVNTTFMVPIYNVYPIDCKESCGNK